MSAAATKINWATRKNKRRNDGQLLTYLQPLLTSGRTAVSLLSLPGPGWLWEAALADDCPAMKFTFFGVERNPKLNASARAKARQMNQQRGGQVVFETIPHTMDWSTVINNRPMPEFDIVYADYMGGWSNEKLDEVIDMFSKPCLIGSKGYFIMTLSLTRNASPMRNFAIKDGKKSNILVLDDQEDLRPNRSDKVHPHARGIAEHVMFAAEQGGYKLSAYPIHIYYNKGFKNDCLPEASFCFRRTT